jgi:hypothetical protein
VFVSILQSAQSPKRRVESGEISPAILRSYIIALKLLCKMNNIAM